MNDAELLAALREGDESAFAALFEKHHAALVRLAAMYVRDRATAEEVAQETWLAVLHGLDRFEGRSSLKTWIYTILINRAKTRGGRESRTLPFSALGGADSDDPAVDPDRFFPHDAPEWADQWKEYPQPWGGAPESEVLNREIAGRIRRAIESLPDLQRQVITLRDIDGFTAEEVCNVLEISETNQRVLLHRARSKVRRALESYFEESRL
ncbi:MAG: sigma-70 family RNA polymerase sigma factor [Chloroflexi bacterium]|nr:sigma-70 family RNA polymerase sigma factor [Chloroflexota bacterium]